MSEAQGCCFFFLNNSLLWPACKKHVLLNSEQLWKYDHMAQPRSEIHSWLSSLYFCRSNFGLVRLFLLLRSLEKLFKLWVRFTKLLCSGLSWLRPTVTKVENQNSPAKLANFWQRRLLYKRTKKVIFFTFGQSKIAICRFFFIYITVWATQAVILLKSLVTGHHFCKITSVCLLFRVFF